MFVWGLLWRVQELSTCAATHTHLQAAFPGESGRGRRVGEGGEWARADND